MATAQSIRDELNSFTEAILELQTFADISIDLAGDDPKAPQWPWLVAQHVRRIEKLSEALECSIRRHALPLLEDMQRLTK